MNQQRAASNFIYWIAITLENQSVFDLTQKRTVILPKFKLSAKYKRLHVKLTAAADAARTGMLPTTRGYSQVLH